MLINVSFSALTNAMNLCWAMSIACFFSMILAIVMHFYYGGRLAKPKMRFFAPFIKQAAPITMMRVAGSFIQPLVAIIIPASCLVTRSQEQCVFVVNPDNTVTLKKVTVGIKVDDMVEILSGLEGNEKVVTKGQTLLNNGTKVNVVSLTEEKF